MCFLCANFGWRTFYFPAGLRRKYSFMNKKVFIGIAIAIVVIIAVVGMVLLLSPKDTPSEGLEYSLNVDGKGYSVIGIGTCKDQLIIIPKKYNGKPVVEIGKQAFYNCKTIVSIQLPTSLKKICDSAFGNSSLTNIYIPNSVTSIGDGAFWNCKSLKSVNIPNSVTSIGSNAFQYCTSLKSIVIPKSMTTIPEGVFSFCTSLESVTIPNSVTKIENGAFSSCDWLSSITIPKSVISIGGWAFEYCTSLRYITFEGTAAQWNAIEKGRIWNDKVPATEVECSDKTVSLK